MRCLAVSVTVLVSASLANGTYTAHDGGGFVCDGGLTVLSPHQINDDYCDCSDGRDETLTPACSNVERASRFVCTSTGPLNQSIPASRVWDGVCDCCDGSDELSNRGGGARLPPPCDPNGCNEVIEAACTEVMAAHHRVTVGLEKKQGAEAEALKIVKEWEAAIELAETDKQRQAASRKEVEKLEAMLKVYLRDEEQLETREREELARAEGCGAGRRGKGGRAAALGYCEDTTAEREAAAKVRAARAAARARKDAEQKEKVVKKNNERGRKGKTSPAQRKRDSSKESGTDVKTAEKILDLRWPVYSDSISLAEGEEREGLAGQAEGISREGGSKSRSPEEKSAMAMSLRTYVKQRQEGRFKKLDAEKTVTKKAEELRETALLGSVLNDGERGVYLGVTYVLRMAGLPTFGVLRGMLTVGEFVRHRVAVTMAAIGAKAGLPASVQTALEGYRDTGLAGLSRHLDYRRYSTLRSSVLQWDQFLDSRGRFLLVMWDAPLALWGFFFPERDYEHERPEAAMLREGIARARASLETSTVDSQGKGKVKNSSRRKGPQAEAERLLGLDLGEGKRFAALAETCLDLDEGGYRYSLCPFKNAKQGDHSLGKWNGWGSEQGRGRHRSMIFDWGSRCHNKRQRSTEVLLECGPDHSLISADEFEVCSYKFTLETPLACSAANLVETAHAVEIFKEFASSRIEPTSADKPPLPEKQYEEL